MTAWMRVRTSRVSIDGHDNYAALAAITSQVHVYGLASAALSVSGSPADELLKAAEGGDMLVVGARGEGGFGRLHMGSVSTQVSHHAHVPVVVVPGDAKG